MSKLQELIDRLCPNGVDFKPLGEVCDFVNGFAFKSNLFRSKGERIIRITNITGSNVDVMDSKYFELNDYSTDLSKYRVQKGNILIAMSGATTGKIGCYNSNENSYINQRVGMFKPHDELSERFLFHFLSTITTELYILAGGGAQPNLSSNQLMSDVRIPIPPLEVQDEIVKILDRFADYAAELQAELQARRLQYEYYRNLLLTFNSSAYSCETDDAQKISVIARGGHSYEIQWKTMGEIFEMRNGYTPSKNKPEFWENGTIPWFRMEDIRENGRILADSIQHITPASIKGKGLFEANTFILATTATIGEHALLIADSLANQQFTNLKVRKSLANLLDTKFIFYYMFIVDEFCKNNTNVSGFASVDMGKLKQMPFPIPPLELQEKIVAILDRFETLVNDLSKGLPAEIEAVKARYEYYRNKLLTFNTLSA